MNYYQFHIGDFRSGTVNMSRKARWIYRDMLDAYYDTEHPLPLDMDILCEMIGVECDEERRIVERHLKFKFTAAEDGFHHAVCDERIAEYRSKADVARANGKKGGRPKANPEKPSGFLSGSYPDATGNPVETESKTNHKPLTTNQEPEDKSIRPEQAQDSLSIRVPYDEILDAFRKRLPGFPQPRRPLDDDRRKAVRAIWTKEEKFGSVDFFDRYFNYVSESDFLASWKGCGFDWLMKTKNFRKVLEGNYNGGGNNA